MTERMPNMDDPFDLAAATKAAKQYERATDAEFISDGEAFTRFYGFAAHTSARHLHAALARLAEVEAERDRLADTVLAREDGLTAARSAQRGVQGAPLTRAEAIARDGRVTAHFEREEPAADPPGLDAAIEAIAEAVRQTREADSHEDYVRTIVRAAAPALRAGALREAARQIALTSGPSVIVSYLRELADEELTK